MTEGWPALDTLLAALRTAPSRTGSVIVTVYGDAIMPRCGALALVDLLQLMQRLGASAGVVRTAVSRLARDGLLEGRRAGRNSAYALTQAGMAQFSAAVPRIYWPGEPPGEPPWDGRLRLVFPGPADRDALDGAGFAPLVPGVMISHRPAPDAVPSLVAEGTAETSRGLAARAWPLDGLRAQYAAFLECFSRLEVHHPAPIDALAARIALVHAWRRIALRDPRLPAALLPPDWPGHAARALLVALYSALARPSEAWLDQAGSGAGPLPPGPDPALRFSGGGR